MSSEEPGDDGRDADIDHDTVGSSHNAKMVQQTIDEMSLQEKVDHLTAQLAKCEEHAERLKDENSDLRVSLERTEELAKSFPFSRVSTEERQAVSLLYRHHLVLVHDVVRILGDSMVGSAFSRSSTGETANQPGGRSRPRGRSTLTPDELIMVLCKLRHDFPQSDLSDRFDISQSTVSRIFRLYVLCLSHTLCAELPA